MRRRIFLAATGLGAASVGLSGAAHTVAHAARPQSQPAELRSYVSRWTGDVAARTGEPLWLKRQPARTYDTNSISVSRAPDAEPIGYLPTDQSRILAPLMDAGFALGATVTAAGRSGIELSVSVHAAPLATS